MDHADALKQKATERYFLGEMSRAEREAFEDHYFGCSDCATDIKSTAALMDNAREIFRTEFAAQAACAQQRSAGAGWFAWMRPAYAMAAVALLVFVIGYQNLVTIPDARRRGTESSAMALTSYSLVSAGSRGGNDLNFNVPANHPFGLYVDIPSNAKYSSYVADVQTESGASKFSVRISADQAKETVQLLIPPSVLASGRYNLVIRGSNAADQNGAGDEIARYPFTLQYNQ
jgi:Putative zinc-finger